MLVYLLMIGILAFFWAVTFKFFQRLVTPTGAGGAGLPMTLALPVAWVAQEWFQSWILTGFPWSYLGYATVGTLTMAQSGDLLGVWGLSFLVALVNAVVYEVYLFIRSRRERFPAVPVAVAVVLLVANAVYGVARLGQVERYVETREPFNIAVLQGNIDQNEKWRNPEIRRDTPRMYLEMAETANAKGDVSLVILPETSLTIWQPRGRAATQSPAPVRHRHRHLRP